MNRTPNLNMEIVGAIAAATGLTFVPEKSSGAGTFYPLDLMDYIYSILHSPSYRDKFKEFLKIDFPRVPYPKSSEQFFALAKLGARLRELHLMECNLPLITSFDISGDNVVEKISFDNGKVFINSNQFFAGVLSDVWEFFVGGYQPAQKWLKDRKGQALSFEDIMHYQKIISSLKETITLMDEIDKLIL